MNTPYNIRRLKKGEEHEMQKLIKTVFSKFVAPGFSQEGIAEFLKVITPESIRDRLKKGNRIIFVTEEEKTKKIIGAIEIRDFNHISLFFIHSKFQKKGIGKTLLKKCIDICKKKNANLTKITVHASPNAVAAYEKFGFQKIGKGGIREKNNIRFMKMKFVLKRSPGNVTFTRMQLKKFTKKA
ncbi:GNAT family N-acetyltransferase [Candidatus Peregrinibacteria bacterium]|nr:GNAT family N-acetyltransferase [Candidatus Peregrinibacteria bacterium]